MSKSTSATTEPEIYSAIAEIMRAVGDIPKGDRNQSQGYDYRGIDRVYNACHPIFSLHGVFQTSTILDAQHDIRDETSANGKPRKSIHTIIRMRYTFFARDGSNVSTEVVGEGVDYGGDKASNKAMSIASKYALLQLLMIPTAMADPEKDEETTPMASGPSVPTRAARVSKDQVTGAVARWKAARAAKSMPDTIDCWSAWVHAASGREFNVKDVNAWTQADLTAVEAFLKELTDG